MEGLRLAPMEVQLEEWERDQPDYGVVCNEANSIVESLEVSHSVFPEPEKHLYIRACI